MKKLDANEIMARFDSAPSSIELYKIDKEVNEVANKLGTLRQKQGKIQAQFTKEQNDIADGLDIEFPNLGLELVKHIQER